MSTTGGHIGNKAHAHQALEDVFDPAADLSRPAVITLGSDSLWLMAGSNTNGKT